MRMTNVAALLLCAFITTANTLDSNSSLLESKVRYVATPTGGAKPSWSKNAGYKWLLSLRLKEETEYIHFCFAIWIAPWFGITANGCLDRRHQRKVFHKKKDLGEIYVTPKSDFGDVSDEEVYKVVNDVLLYRYIRDCEGQVPHNMAENSISFVKFEKNIELPESNLKRTIFEEEVRPSVFIGWNNLEHNWPSRNTLAEIKIEKLKNSKCNLDRNESNQICVRPMICWQVLTNVDLGGPVLIEDKGPGVLVSIGQRESKVISLLYYKEYIDKFKDSLGKRYF